MGRRKKNQEENEGIAEWMLTYSDLVTLLLTFFILLFSMATIDKQKFIVVANSLRSQFMHYSNGDLFLRNNGDVLVSIVDKSDSQQEILQKQPDEASEKEKKLSETIEKLEDIIKRMNLGKYVAIVEEKNMLIVRIDSVVLFDIGSADIKNSGQKILEKLGKMLIALDHEIVIQGHTDNYPINTILFPTNWELSTKRATNVVLFLIDKCKIPPTKLTATGNGEFKPIYPNDSEVHRQKNRRIDIVIDK